MRPTTIILGADNRKKWSKWDIVLVRAKERLESERCAQCGLPKYICQNDNRDIEFRIEKEVCYASIALDKYESAEEEKRAKKKGKDAQKAPAGEVAYPVPYLLSGGDLGALREPFWEDYNKRQEQIAAARRSD